MAKQTDFDTFLTPEGEGLFESIKLHFSTVGTWNEGYRWELAMLANSFALYFDAAKTVNECGTSVEIGKQGYKQVSPDYIVMKTEYANILKHSPKFGLNPADLARIFKGQAADKPKMTFDTDTPMRAAK